MLFMLQNTQDVILTKDYKITRSSRIFHQLLKLFTKHAQKEKIT